MGKAEKVTLAAADLAKLSAGELEALLEQKRTAERAAAEALTPLRETEAAAALAVKAYEKDLADVDEQVADAKKWLDEVTAHRTETAATLESLRKDHAAAAKALQDAGGA